MRISEVSIRRPVFATVISLLLIIFGFVLSEMSRMTMPPSIQPT